MSPVSHRRVRRRWAVAVLVAFVALAAGLGQTSLGHTILRKAGLFQEPTSYTTLAFLHTQPLPEQLGPKRADVGVSFVIQNISGISRDYQWSVLLVQGGHTSRVAAGSVQIASGRDTAITRSARIFCTRGQVRIVVSLASPAEFIDALTTCSPRS